MTTTRAATISLLVLMLPMPAMARHKDSAVAMLEFEVLEGLAIVQVKTSVGNLRLLADTGSNATTLNEIIPRGGLVIKFKDYELLVKPYPIQTPVFAMFNAAVPKEQRLDGILGQDFFSQFSSVAFDYAHHRLILSNKVESRSGFMTMLESARETWVGQKR
jgi:hypothetical protein